MSSLPHDCGYEMLNEPSGQASAVLLPICVTTFHGVAKDRHGKAGAVLAKGAVAFGAVGKSLTEETCCKVWPPIQWV